MFFASWGEGFPHYVAILSWGVADTAHGHFTTLPDVSTIGNFSDGKYHW